MKQKLYGVLMVIILLFVVAIVGGCDEKDGRNMRTNNRELNDYEDAVRNHEHNRIEHRRENDLFRFDD